MRRGFARAGLRLALVAVFVSLIPVAAQPAGAITLVDEFDVFANSPTGTTSTASLDPSKTYMIESSGSFSYDLFGTGLNDADAECHNLVTGTPLVPGFWDILLGNNILDLLVGGSAVAWQPANASATGCDDPLLGGNNVYTVTVVPPSAGAVNFRIKDVNHTDNAGSLHVRIFELPPAPPTDDRILLGVTMVNSLSNFPVFTLPTVPGFNYQLEAVGSFVYDGGSADSECSITTVDPTWIPARYGLFGGEDWLDLLVDDTSVTWVPVGETDPGCSAVNHTYRHDFAGTGAPVSLVINDSYYGDNGGIINVSLYLKP